MSVLETWLNTSQDPCGSDRWEVMYSYTDAQGKGYGQVVPGDKHLGSEAAYPWVVNGFTALNKKGISYRTCEGTPLPAPLLDPYDVVTTVESLDGNNCSQQYFDVVGRPTRVIAPDGQEGLAQYGVDFADTWDHLDLYGALDGDYGTYSTERVDGQGRTVANVVRYRDESTGGVMQRWTTADYAAIGGPRVVSQFEVPQGADGTADPASATGRTSRRARYDTLGRLRVNLDPNFGRWEYQYDHLGQLTTSISPMGNVGEFFYDGGGRLIREIYDGELEAEYFYDAFPESDLVELDEDPVSWNGYPSYAVTTGRLVAVRDRTGITVTAGNWGTFSESWRQVWPDRRVYHFETLVDGAGQLIYSEDPDGHRSTADYYADGTFKSSYWSYYGTDTTEHRYQIVKETRSNVFGQTELVEFGDPSETVVWTGYDPVSHRKATTVVQQLNPQYTGAPETTTLAAYSYQYDPVGKLRGVADWRGRDASESTLLTELIAPHPAIVNASSTASFAGYHFPTLGSVVSGENRTLDADMNAPAFDEIVGASGWPLGAAPSDAVFGYDGLYRLVEEDRAYASGLAGNDDPLITEDGQVGDRVKSLSWRFDERDSMTSWEDVPGSEEGRPKESLGRALGGTILNGYQLNELEGQTECMDSLATSLDLPQPSDCYIPDALYFATNVGDEGVGTNEGICIWAD